MSEGRKIPWGKIAAGVGVVGGIGVLAYALLGSSTASAGEISTEAANALTSTMSPEESKAFSDYSLYAPDVWSGKDPQNGQYWSAAYALVSKFGWYQSPYAKDVFKALGLAPIAANAVSLGNKITIDQLSAKKVVGPMQGVKWWRAASTKPTKADGSVDWAAFRASEKAKYENMTKAEVNALFSNRGTG